MRKIEKMKFKENKTLTHFRATKILGHGDTERPILWWPLSSQLNQITDEPKETEDEKAEAFAATMPPPPSDWLRLTNIYFVHLW